MRHWSSYLLRAGFIVGFLIVLPIMAVPQVASFLDELLYGKSESGLPPVVKGKESPLATSTESTAEGPTEESPFSGLKTTFLEEPAGTIPHGEAPLPPGMGRTPDFVQPAGVTQPLAGRDQPVDVGPLDGATAEEIDAVRQRLDELGAEYIRLEMSENGREYHCLCQMPVGNSPGQLQPFEATRGDPIAAAKAVLASVEAWRTAERTPFRGAKRGPETGPR